MSRLTDPISAVTRLPSALRRNAEERRHRKLMRDAPRYGLAELPDNTFGKIVGVARPDRKKLLEAPLSGRLCVYYEVAVDAMAGTSMLRTLTSEQEGIAFVLADGDARVFVDPAHAMVSTRVDHVSTSTLNLASARQQALLERIPWSGRRVPLADGWRYRESIIEVDKRIAVFGGGVREPDPDGRASGYRDGPPTRLCLTGTDRFPLFISDDPRVVR